MKKYLFLGLGLLLMLMWGCTSKPHTTVIYNVNGYTIGSDGGLHTFEAIAFKDGKILETGAINALLETYTHALHLDYEGKTMLPGLIDAHAHIMGLGESLLRVNLAGSATLEEARQRVADYADEYDDLQWITGRGWNQTHWPENEFPTAADLDEIVSDRPVFLRRVDGHAAWVNTLALELAGIDEDTADPQGGAILRNEDGSATGILIDRAMYLISEHIPAPDENEQRRALDLALENITRLGITGVHDAGVSSSAFRLYQEYASRDRLTTRIYGLISGAGATFDELSADGPYVSVDDMLTLRSVKLYSDGALGSRGAALKEDYSDEPGNRGLLFDTEDAFFEQIKKVTDAGFQAGVHAIGDKANYVILNAFERVNAEFANHGLRHRIEHAQIVDVEDIPRFAELGLIASMQPTHATSDMNMAEDRVGPDRIRGGYAWRTFLDLGVVVASGSDFPVEEVNPFYGLHSAVTRTDHDGNPLGGWYSEMAMNREEALRSFTLDAAYAGHAEDRLGTLETGKWADFIIIDEDYFNMDESQIFAVNVLETWVAGRRMFSKE